MRESQRGVLYGAAAYGMWGLFPLYWPLLKPSGAVEILAHRIAWSLLVVIAILALRRHWSWVRELLSRPRTIGLLALAALIISVNWGVYIYGVNTDRVVESSLGYFINPLVSILFGVVVFRERLRPWQWAAVGLGAVAVLVLTVDYGRPPWIALILAATFGTYGLVKKVAQVGAAESLAVETLFLVIPALGYIAFLYGQGASTFGDHGAAHTTLIVASGIVTAIPLILFTSAALRVPLTTIGLLQYIAPVLQFLAGVFIAREAMPPSRWIGFAIVWVALMIFTWDGLRETAKAKARTLESTPPLPEPERV
ncbi:EamA family transporter RarD [Rhizohabitans arisaemae]|uniref:EamA family transporter RarD n=1 Tax=Rhizohabitans arisaemae TaxID=2720610 RepID=UPI0024B1FCDD|nr:EamA family transporter RarD [Rhizohabitans arisaemae]